ncbi:MAG: cysteine peptidase family C39 domain-containing protein [Desulfovibrio sp.]|uniref:cysteine peptidase family C39 domain-containing protein n=1 Tax=Desulfovibrio sp. 7SRBS1 TaxID=3378064 RepID=UPI003B3DFFBD
MARIHISGSFFILAVMLSLLCSCSTHEKEPPVFQRETNPQLGAVTLPDFVKNAPSAHQAMTLKVPVILQRDNYSSGPTSLAMVMGSYDVKTYHKKEVWKRSGTTFRQVLQECGNDMDGLERAARSYGFSRMKFVKDATLDDVRKLLNAGVAPIANVRSFHSSRPDAYCSVVVAGYSPTAFLLHDPTKGVYKIPPKKFLQHWQAHLCTPQKGMVERSLFILYPKEGVEAP